MGGKSLLISTVSGSANFNTASTTLFITPTNSNLNGMQAVEASAEVTARQDATVSILGLRVNANSRTTTSTLRFRKNGANGNGVISVSAGATGYFEDTTNSDTLTNGDTFCFAWTNGSGAGSIFLVYASGMIESNGATAPAHSYYGVASGTLLSSSLNANRWFSPGGSLVSAADNAGSRFAVPADGVLSNISCNVTVNAKAASMTLRSRVNAAFGNQTVTIGAGATGKFEDTTNTDTIASGDLINYQLTMSGSGNLTITRVTAMFTGTQAMNATFVTGHGSNAHNAPRHMPWAGDTRINNGENTVDFNMPYGFTFSHLYAQASWAAANQLIKFRKNAADGNLVTTSAGVGAAVVTDLVNVDTTVAGDNTNLISDPNATAIGLGWQSLRLTDPQTVVPNEAGGVIITQGF